MPSIQAGGRKACASQATAATTRVVTRAHSGGYRNNRARYHAPHNGGHDVKP